MVRYYGYYSNKSRGMRKKAEQENQDSGGSDSVQVIVDSGIGKKKLRKNWARLIQKVYNVDPLLCPKCGKNMRIIAFIEDDTVIRKILMHLNLWRSDNHDPPSRLHGRAASAACDQPGSIPLQIQPHRSFEWWEAVNKVSGHKHVDDNSNDLYEDDYSQLTHYEN